MKEKINAFWTNLKAAVGKFYSTNAVAAVFITVTAASFIVYALLSLIIGGDFFIRLYFENDDSFMDFFNSIRDVSLLDGVYTERKVIYPPLANLIFLAFSRLTPESYASTEFGDRYAWKNYTSLIILIMLFLISAAVIFALIASKQLKLPPKTRAATVFFLIMNVPMLYLLERGNVIIYSIIAVMIFMFNYDSPSRLSREIAIFSLAVAFALKIYPAVFGWVLVTDKRWKDVIKCVIYGALLFLLPSFFFGGPVAIQRMLENISVFSDSKSNWLNTLKDTLRLPKLFVSATFYFILILSVASFVLTSLLCREKWKIWALAVSVLVFTPSIFRIYSWAFFIPPIILFICDKEAQKSKFNLFVVGLMLLPLPLFFVRAAVIRTVMYVILVAILVAFIINTAQAAIKFALDKGKQSIKKQSN